MNRKYNYVVLNSIDKLSVVDNVDGYYYICAMDLMNSDGICLVNQPFDCYEKIRRGIFTFLSSKRFCSMFGTSISKLLYPFWFNAQFSSDKPICFVAINPQISNDYYKYLKSKYPNCKIVAVHRDMVKIWKPYAPQFFGNPLFDLELSIDVDDCREYGMVFFPEFESKIEIEHNDLYRSSDLFFAGKAKDRLPKIMEVYKIFTDNGFKCYFYLTGVPKKDRIPMEGVIYGDKQLTYREMLQLSVNSKCILEINQEGAKGFTSRFLEAVIYNKRLITDNLEVKKNKYYNPRFIQCVEDVKKIDPNFILSTEEVYYNYNGEFSPLHLIDMIEKEL